MKKIFYKYIYLNGKNIIYGLLSALFFSTIAFDSNKYYSVALLMVPSLLFSFIVGKMCYEEDSNSTKEFLLALPIQKQEIALEKNLIGQLCIILGITIVNSMFFIINSIKGRDGIFDIRLILLVACFLIVYNTTYINLNYKFDYSKTQFSSYVILILMLFLFKFGNEFMIYMEKVNSWGLLGGYIILSIISLLLIKRNNW